jgi:zinc protease
VRLQQGTYARSKEAYQSFAIVQEDKQLSGLKVLATENERAKKFGFTQAELDRAKSEISARYEKQFKTDSDNFVAQFQAEFLEEVPAPGIEWEFNMTKQLLPEVSLADVNFYMEGLVKEDNRVVVITGPEKRLG